MPGRAERRIMITKYTDLARCPNCGKMASKGNFCEHCTLKMVKKCTCWQAGTIKEKYCNGKYCPGFEAYTKAMLVEEYHKLYQLPLFFKRSRNTSPAIPFSLFRSGANSKADEA